MADGGERSPPSAPRLERGDVDGLRPLVAGLGVIGDLRALGQRLEAVRVDAGVVDEQVLATLVRRDEAQALVAVEPLDGSGCHVIPPRLCALRTRRLPKATTAGAETLCRRALRARPEHLQGTAAGAPRANACVAVPVSGTCPP